MNQMALWKWKYLWRLRIHKRLKLLLLWEVVWDLLPTKSKIAERVRLMEKEDFVMRAVPFEKELCKDKLCKAMQMDSFSVGSAILWDTNGTFLGAAAVKMERLKPVQAETEAAKFGVLELVSIDTRIS